MRMETTTMLKVRQLTDEEAHILDHLVDTVMTTGSLIMDKVETELLRRGSEIVGSYSGLQTYVLAKIARIHGKPVEEYDEGPVEWTDPLPRAPFGGTWEGVPRDTVTAQYMTDSWQHGHRVPEVDLAPGIGDRLELGMKRRRKK
jgi:hypothetical protein